MTREHLEAVNRAVGLNYSAASKTAYNGFKQLHSDDAARLAEVAAMIEAKLEEKI